MIRTGTPPRTVARVAIIGVAILAVAGCSSDSKKSDRDSERVKNAKPAAAVSEEATPSTTEAPKPAAPACTTNAAKAALSPDTVNSITCEADYAAGSASNPDVDYAYLLQAVNGSWEKASASVQQEVCTSNPQGLSASFVADACDD